MRGIIGSRGKKKTFNEICISKLCLDLTSLDETKTSVIFVYVFVVVRAREPPTLMFVCFVRELAGLPLFFKFLQQCS